MTAVPIAPANRVSSADLAAGRIRRNPKVVAGLALMVFFILAATAHPILQATVWADEQGLYRPLVGYDPAIDHPSGTSPDHLLGTDALGRDVLSLLTFALRSSLLVALIVAMTVGVLSILFGSLAAYYRGWVDNVVSHLGDAITLFPPPIALIIIGLGRPDFGPVLIAAIYGVLYGLGPATTVVRSRGLTVMAKPFIEAARVAGSGPRRIIGSHLIPDLLPFAAVQMMAGVTAALIAQALVEFLSPAGGKIGLGSLVYLGLTYRGLVSLEVPWTQLLAGALSISFLAGSFYMISVGLREATDPKFKGRSDIP